MFDEKTRSGIMGVTAGCIMLLASALPWLRDPLGQNYSAWQLPIDIGWQFHSGAFNYGLLCLGCAIYAFASFLAACLTAGRTQSVGRLASKRSAIAYAGWRPRRWRDPGHTIITRVAPTHAGLLCCVPVVLFLLQYLFVDNQGIERLAQHENQALLVQSYFGYYVAPQRIPLSPFNLDIGTFWNRPGLLVNSTSVGVLLPLLSAWLLRGRGRFAATPYPGVKKKRRTLAWLIGAIVCLVIVGRAPASMLCDIQARAALVEGNYTNALKWLNTALFFNPSLDQVAYYHIERGQALYFLSPGQQSDDSRVYLASALSKQGAYQDAYLQLLAIGQSSRHASWFVDELSLTLERLAESTGTVNDVPGNASAGNAKPAALPWLQLLIQADRSNVYGRYVVGRIQYDLHNYTASMEQMSGVIQLSTDSDIQSSAYTYLALNAAGQSDYLDERTLLFRAVQLDPNYHNNTAREELSGLH